MPQILFALVALSTNVFVLAFVVYSLFSATARQGVNDLVSEALRYIE